MSRRASRSRQVEPQPTSTVVVLPRTRRRGPGADAIEARKRRQQQQEETNADASRPHGWGRADDPEVDRSSLPSFLQRRRADGTPLLLFTVLAVLTGVGLARVDSRIEILDTANEITELSEDQQRLLDRKRRLETERAYLRRPTRVGEQATTRLGMVPAPPERIQRIELKPPEPAPAPTPEPEPTPQPTQEPSQP